MQTKYKTPYGYNSYEDYRSYDNRACKIVNEFLDEKFYPYITITFQRTEKVDKQVQGIDCLFVDRNHTRYICDEKSAVKYTNKKLKTHAFEIQFINRAGNLHDGWFIEKNQINDTYNLIYTDRINDEEGDFDYQTFTSDQIRELHGYIIRKENLKAYLYSLGVTEELMLAKCKEIRETDGKCDMGDIERDGYRFYFSKQLPEKPINILIDRKMLDVLADYTYIYNKGNWSINFKK